MDELFSHSEDIIVTSGGLDSLLNSLIKKNNSNNGNFLVQYAEEEEIREQLEDPVLQQRERELDIRQAEVQRKMKADAERLALDLEKAKATNEVEKERIASQERIAGANIGLKAATENKKISSKEQIEGAKIGRDIAETLLEDE